MSFSRCLTAVTAGVSALLIVGCANPGPPKPPSLQIPAIVSGLKAERRGNTVELQFTLPQRTSDGLNLRPGSINARLCRAVETGICQPLPKGPGVSFPVTGAPSKDVSVLRDELGGALSGGAPRLLTYRLELFNAAGRTAGYSNPAFAVAGPSPRMVEGLHAEGSRLGTVLRWLPSDPQAEVVLVREDLDRPLKTPAQVDNGKARKSKLEFQGIGKDKIAPAVVTLSAQDDLSPQAGRQPNSATLDTTATPGVSYRYTAERKQHVVLDGHALESWSKPSAPLNFTLHDTFPPPTPSHLSIAGYTEQQTISGKTQAYVVDLIWEPIDDEQLAGYKVYRTEMPATRAAESDPDQQRKVLLTVQPVKVPAFHDTTANGSKRYRYSVTAIDLRGNESDAVTGLLEP